MDIFYKRPLSLILCIMLGGFALFTLLPEDFISISFIGLLFICLLIAPKRVGITATTVAILALVATLALAIIYPIYFKVYERFPSAVNIEAIVTEIDTSVEYETELDLKTKSINGESVSYKLKLSLAPSEIKNIRRGSVISLTGELCHFDESGDYDAGSYYTSRGFSAKIESASDITVTDEVSLPNFAYLRELIARRSIMQSGRKSASLFIALFTGDRALLSPDLALAFTRTGINHVLALSGTHLVILSAMLERFLRLFAIGKKPRLVALAATVVFYMALTGFSASVTRAGVMLLITTASFLFASSRDSITALSLAVFLIILAEPYAIADLGLWLSALATLGVIEAGGLGKQKRRRWCYRPEPRGKRILKKLILGIAVTLYATSATLAISTFSFSGISPLSVITTPLFSVLSELYIYIGIAALALGDLIPLGRLLPPLYEVTDRLAEAFSVSKIAYFSAEFTAVKILAAIATAVFFAFLVLKLRRKLVGVILSVAMLAATLVCAGVLTNQARLDDTVRYYSGKSSECILMRSEGELAILDLSSGLANSKYTVLDARSEVNALEVDRLIFAYYTSNLPKKAYQLTGAVLIREIFLPRPKNEDERKISDQVEKTLADSNTEIKYYLEDRDIAHGALSLREVYRSSYGNGAPRSIIRIDASEENIYYLSSGILEDKKVNTTTRNAIASANHLIIGAGGKSYKDNQIINAKHTQLKSILLAGSKVYFTQEARIFYDENATSFYLRPKSLEILP